MRFKEFRLPKIYGDESSVEMDSGELSMLLEGIDMSRVRPAEALDTAEKSRNGAKKRK